MCFGGPIPWVGVSEERVLSMAPTLFAPPAGKSNDPDYIWYKSDQQQLFFHLDCKEYHNNE